MVGRCRFRRVALVLTVALFVGGCSSLTDKLYEHDRYTEDLESMLVTENQQRLVLITPEHHYIFEAPSSLIEVLDQPFRDHIRLGDQRDVALQPDHKVTATFQLRLDADATAAEREAAKAFGFESTAHGMVARHEMEGKRYRAGDRSEAVNQALESRGHTFNKEYKIEVRVAPSALETMAKVPLTPITVAADGAVTLMSVALIPVFLWALRSRAADIPSAGRTRSR